MYVYWVLCEGYKSVVCAYFSVKYMKRVCTRVFTCRSVSKRVDVGLVPTRVDPVPLEAPRLTGRVYMGSDDVGEWTGDPPKGGPSVQVTSFT